MEKILHIIVRGTIEAHYYSCMLKLCLVKHGMAQVRFSDIHKNTVHTISIMIRTSFTQKCGRKRLSASSLYDYRILVISKTIKTCILLEKNLCLNMNEGLILDFLTM